MDYFVPNFGMDKDIIATETNEKVASALVGKAWSFKTPESWEKYRNHAKDADYNFDPALSEDRMSCREETVRGDADAAARVLQETRTARVKRLVRLVTKSFHPSSSQK